MSESAAVDQPLGIGRAPLTKPKFLNINWRLVSVIAAALMSVGGSGYAIHKTWPRPQGTAKPSGPSLADRVTVLESDKTHLSKRIDDVARRHEVLKSDVDKSTSSLMVSISETVARTAVLEKSMVLAKPAKSAPRKPLSRPQS